MNLASSRRARRLLGSLGWLATLALAGFHGLLLWTRIVQGDLVEPPVAARWMATALVLAGFRALHRGGSSLFGGRRAVALWLIVILLHVQVAASRAPVAGDLSPLGHLASAVLVTGTASLAGLALLLVLVFGGASTARRAAPLRSSSVRQARINGVRRLARALHVVARPPPHASARPVFS